MRTQVRILSRNLTRERPSLPKSRTQRKQCIVVTSQIVPITPRTTARRFFATNSTQPPNYTKESVNPETHYDFFPESLSSGPPPKGKFQIDLSALRREFLQLQAAAHPDRHQGQSKARAEALSARINDAYKTLQNPLLRAQYLLTLHGIDVANDETAKEEDQKLLANVLDAREEIEEAESEEDLKWLKRTNDERIRLSEAVLETAFETGDVNVAKTEAVRLRYWVNIKESLQAWEKGKPVILVH